MVEANKNAVEASVLTFQIILGHFCVRLGHRAMLYYAKIS